MIERRDIEAAIAECQGKRNPDANTCVKLAAFYTIRKELFGESEQTEAVQPPGYSYAPDPEAVHIDTDSEFARVIDGMEQDKVWPVLDELMDTIKTIHPRLYNAVLDRLEQ